MRIIFLLFAVFLAVFGFSQGIHQEELNHYNSLGLSDSQIEALNTPASKVKTERSSCALNKIVYGWHPYWSNGLEVNYDWNLLSHFCYFGFELDATTGHATTTHSFATTSSVTTALANGVKVNLCVTLFSNHATFLTNAISKQNLIDDLIALISSRGAHGVNIDFEGLPLSQKTNFTNFMNDLANQMHAAIPGSQVSSVLYAVDWSDVIDVAAMPNVDFFVIMGYDYYWSGSSTAGPTDPLFQFSTSYDYTISKSVTNYLDMGLPSSKLVLGLPYYGREWPVASSGIPSATTASGVSRTFMYVKDNTSGNYSSANRHFDGDSYSAYYEFNSGGLKQCFITEGYEMSKRLDLINKRGIAGMGIWALGYDDGYTDMWDAISTNLTNCAITNCYDTLYDVGGGPNKKYYDNENYTYTIAPPGATHVQVDFTAFNLESGYDYLYVYDGPTTASAQVAGSPFTGSSIPASILSSTGSVTFKFTSDGATTANGFKATYQCIIDPPPICAFSITSTEFCISDSILLNNTTSGAVSYNWSGIGVQFNDSTSQFPYATFSMSGSYDVQLIANGAGGSDTLTQTLSVTVVDLPVADFSVLDDTVWLPSAFVACSNSSFNASSFTWNFGDGNTSLDINPWNEYAANGTYQITLIANNGVCPNDTAFTSIVVNGSIGVLETNENNSINVFPNPANSLLSIQSSNAFFSKILLKDVSGRIVIANNLMIKTQYSALDISALTNGVYLAEIFENENILHTIKIVKE